ncbi:uncharacterized protein LOC141632303 [Silene latifolia]|uniref:uncharacterized protein LOC141632303 n=1 Tax=Silene latifolia TaxID=37657 RepID=UPI003D77AED7
MTQNLIKSYNQGAISPRCLIKVDIRKAFDSIQWEFISNMLTGLNFPATFVKWIMGCITSTWFSLKINGSQRGFFPGKSGVRQGDPISLYIFVLGMEMFSRHLRRIHLLHQVSYHPKCVKLKLNHLIFADDLMVFMRGDTPSVAAVATCLDSFASISGLYANPAKTNIYYGGVDDEVKRQINALTGYIEDAFPFRYLGITLNPGRLTSSMFNMMVDKIQGSIHHWSGNLLSYAGKLQLINAVVFGLENFWCSVLLLPSHIIKLVNKLCKDYFWGTCGQQRRMVFKSWSSICKPCIEGGYNVKELLSWNKALLCKWVWQLTQNRDNILVSWCRSYNLNGHTIWEAQPKIRHAESWRDIIKIKNYLLQAAGSVTNAQRMLDSCVKNGNFCVGKAYHIFRDKGRNTRWAEVRRNMISWLGFSGIGAHIDVKDYLYKLMGGTKKRKWRNKVAASCVAGMVYVIWHERNSRIFDGLVSTPDQISTTLQYTLKLRLSDSCDRYTQNWDHFSESLNSIIAVKNELIHATGSHDAAHNLLHSWCIDGKFHTHLAYNRFRPKFAVNTMLRLPFGKAVEPKKAIIASLALQKRLTTVDILQRRGLIIFNRCTLCKSAAESHSHLFFKCSYSQALWRGMLAWMRISGRSNCYIAEFKWCAGKKAKKHWKHAWFVSCLVGTLYAIWAERNSRIFTDKESTVEQDLFRLKYVVSVYLLHKFPSLDARISVSLNA